MKKARVYQMFDLLLNCHDVDDVMLQVLCCSQLRRLGHLLIFDSTKTLHYLNMYDPTLNVMCAKPM